MTNPNDPAKTRKLKFSVSAAGKLAREALSFSISGEMPDAKAIHRYNRIAYLGFCIAEGKRTPEDLILQALQKGVARFEASTGEFCFNGLRYSATDRDWQSLVTIIGADALIAALNEKEGA